MMQIAETLPRDWANQREITPAGVTAELDCRGAADLMRALAERGHGVAIVGARAAKIEGMQWARDLGAALSRASKVVVSGGALGIDGAAHEGALLAGAPTVVVLGTGVDVAYPERHAPLFERIVAAGGALVSPFPRGTTVRRHQFPMRNKVIAQLACTVIVAEASERSGSLITAGFAKRLGIPVWARPGTPGCDALLRQGARPALDIDAVVATLLGRAAPQSSLNEHLERMLHALARPHSAAELGLTLQLDLTTVLERLLELEVLRRIVRLPDGRSLAISALADTKE